MQDVVKVYAVDQDEITQWVNLLGEQGPARLRALSQLGRIGVQARGHRPLQRGSLRTPAFPFLTQDHLDRVLGALSDPAPVVRREVAFVLGELGGEAAVSPLARLATDPNADVRLIAVDALAKIGGSQAVQALIQAARDDNELVRARTVHALGQLARGEEGSEVELVRETLVHIREGDASAYVRDAAREALVTLEGEKAPVPEPP